MKKLMKGNDAIVHGSLLGGLTHYFGYPITPANEISETGSYYIAKAGRTFMQVESEIGAINMIMGAAASGARAMTASSGPGIALMGEGLSYLAGAELPCVVVDIQRCGTGLGYIFPEQGDYNMVVKGGGHGIYKNIVLAPNSAQEMADCAYKAFELSEKYRMTVFILSDAYVGQMMEAVELPSEPKHVARNSWSVYADAETRNRLVTSLYLTKEELNQRVERTLAKYKLLKKEIVDFEDVMTEDADYVFTAFGICSRICHTAVKELRGKGIKAGLLRPKTLFPFPEKQFVKIASQAKKIFSVELNEGQMHEDVKLSVNGRIPVEHCGWYGGNLPSVTDLVNKVLQELN